jgi:antitoxin CcdA
MRMAHAHAKSATAKKATNLSVNAELLRQARLLKINCSALLEEALKRRVDEKLRAKWLEENSAAIEDYNASVDEDGVFGDGVRTF